MVALVAITLPFFYSSDLTDSRTTYSKMLMGTVVEITLKGDEGAPAAELAFDEIARLERIFSSYIPTSEVSMVSASAGKGPVAVGEDLMNVLETTLMVSEASSGAFDPTVGVLREVWTFNDGSNDVPTRGEVAPLLALVDYKKIKIDRDAGTVWITGEDMTLDLGGVAKGYIVGKAVEVLKATGVRWSIIKAGGDMWAFDDDKGAPFTIGVQHPRKTGKLLGAVTFPGGAVATSGDYERFFIKDGKRYHHIIDPVTGMPATASMSVTVVSRDPALADAMSTALFVMGPAAGMLLVEETKGIEAVFVDGAGEVTVSEGLSEGFVLF